MKVLWTLFKVVIALALAIPLSILLLATALGILGALVGVAVFALKFAVLALIGYGTLRVIGRLVRGPTKTPVYELPSTPVDPHYEAAMRELDQELGHVSR